MRRAQLAVAVLATSLTVGLVGPATPVSATRVGGAINLFITPSKDGVHGAVIVTGAIGDYGNSLFMDQNGKPATDGNYAMITLRSGAFEIDATVLLDKVKAGRPTTDLATCSAEQSVTAPVSLLNGSGLYRGITGTVSLTSVFALIGPRYQIGKNKGQCDPHAQPLAQYFSVQGSGTVRFS